ncbi:MAG: hypothetical protein PHE43_02200 [Candidatus Nanoarchaeia archaeon]|nr:hypothetical protein [Candidatus Nanoarchaeia archaeon]
MGKPINGVHQNLVDRIFNEPSLIGEDHKNLALILKDMRYFSKMSRNNGTFCDLILLYHSKKVVCVEVKSTPNGSPHGEEQLNAAEKFFEEQGYTKIIKKLVHYDEKDNIKYKIIKNSIK